MKGPVLVDTSVWIDHFNGNSNMEADTLADLLDAGRMICVCPPILQEILQGLNDGRQFQLVKAHLLRQIVLNCEAVEAAIGAAEMYQALRRKGVSIRSSNDCLIAYYAIHHHTSILQRDRDFKNIAAHTDLKLFALK
jgi:predicted nucleic acid-binding protein